MTVAWDECLGESDSWLLKPLQQQLYYEKPLPVQQAVVPAVQRALLSGIPMDFCLTAPTGSGKTLCYLLPMLRLVAECKRGVDHTRLRALVLVPTKALGTQVFRELEQLTRGTTIAVESLCKASNSVREEAESIVRTATVVTSISCSVDAENPEPGDVHNTYECHAAAQDACNDGVARGSSRLFYYSRVDILVATPQRLLRHLDGTPGLSLADLRLLVIDEADQVLAGNFANFVAKVVERFEEEQMTRLGGVGGTRRLVQLTYNLHKMLCSATLSSHIARISEVRLRNCRHLALDSFGSDIRREDEGEPLQLAKQVQAQGKKRRGAKDGADGQPESDGEGAGDPAAALPISRQQLVRTSFALPPKLQEHVVFVEDWYRHAVLLKLVRTIISKQRAGCIPAVTTAVVASSGTNDDEVNSHNDAVQSRADGAHDMQQEDDDNLKEEENEAEFRVLGYRRRASQLATISSPSDYPSCNDDAGKRILVFCRTAEEARVMGHFLLSAGVQATEFTTLSTESERRRALLKSSPDACIVASDALMRGVDVPNVGHVIMYSPPETLAQYVHRAGRTARAMRAGHLHLLLQKNGPSGTQSDGEVAVFKALSSAVSRSQPVQYERHFFMFDHPKPLATTTTATATDGPEPATKDKACLLVEEADAYLKKTQARLATHWSSALESNQKEQVVKKRSLSASDGATRHAPPVKKERKL
ncbi:ATP-dependent DEAD/H RNA helicase [Trypanosoma rangeli]|uniref:ATP-dependent RNA helicase n=1 Tax=Trypanosoma rangeli TaxID=5698 RepID=A0A3R7NJH7_TRYRA|nr:ATP-dependent DEAD/H RNA helicase [Trypanosoma rangeli]RNF07399.1 ATP-dependent DEAD/H RNA helicase [Trypanosoma rangeli]|eukprot:RNF07399.1 ATP-dependent DEAD/H RNA helicase [Trypanosoma rangeli]